VPVLSYAVVAVAAYLLGSIPTGYLAGRTKGIDVRKIGSGNIGATNTMRALGKPAGIVVLLIDALKGYAVIAWVVPVIYPFLAPHWTYIPFDKEPLELQMKYDLPAGIFVVLGHDFTCWLRFKGGKGIATSAGVFLALAPLALGIALGVWVLVFVLCRYVSVASIAAALSLPAAVWILPPRNLLLGLMATVLGLLAVIKHEGNIKRLFNGTERRFSEKPPTPEVTK